MIGSPLPTRASQSLLKLLIHALAVLGAPSISVRASSTNSPRQTSVSSRYPGLMEPAVVVVAAVVVAAAAATVVAAPAARTMTKTMTSLHHQKRLTGLRIPRSRLLPLRNGHLQLSSRSRYRGQGRGPELGRLRLTVSLPAVARAALTAAVLQTRTLARLLHPELLPVPLPTHLQISR